MRAMLPDWFNYFFQTRQPLTYLLAQFLLMLIPVFFLLRSRRIHARALPPASHARFFQQLALRIAPPKLSGKRRQIKPGQKLARSQRNVSLRSRVRREKLSSAALRMDRLLHDKLRLLPSVESGRNINSLAVLFITFIIIEGYRWYTVNEHRLNMVQIRFRTADATSQELMLLFFSFFLIFALAILCAAPLFLLKKDREFYLDIFAWLALCHLSYLKLRCWYWQCCFGIPWEGIGGIANRRLAGTTVFPVQLAEFAVGMLMAALCLLFMTRSRWYKPGRGLSVALIGYALPRFFWEFLRYRGEIYRPIATEGFFFGLTIEQVVCIIAVLLAIIWWLALPLEKKILDWVSDTLRRALVWVYFRPRVHARLSKYLSWHSSVAKLEEERLT